MYEYEKLAEAPVSEDFFERRLRSLRASIEERRFHITLRERTHYVIDVAIENERRVHEDRLRRLTINYPSERAQLSKLIEGLNREERAELRNFHDRVAQLSRELREKEEEYEAMSQLFRTRAVEDRGTRDPGR